MSIGKNIKTIRRAKNMTQEELAEYLSVSVSAVSQWESERTTPDISLLPPLCNLLGVTSDELLEIDVTRKKEKITELIDEISEISRLGNKKEACRRFKEALREYPDSYDLMYWVASTEYWLTADESYSEEEREDMANESIALLEKIMENCTDEKTRISSVSDLCYLYCYKGQNDKAEELAKNMPLLCESREFLLSAIYKGTERIKSSQNLIYNLVQFLVNRMTYNYSYDSGELLYSDEEIVKLHEKRIKLLELLFENGDYGFYNDDMQMSFYESAKFYAVRGENEKALDCIERAADCAIEFINFANEPRYAHTSLLFKNYIRGSGGIWFGEADNNAADMLKLLENEVFGSLRGGERFVSVCDKLKKYAGKW